MLLLYSVLIDAICNERKLKESINVLVVIMKGVKLGIATYEALIEA